MDLYHGCKFICIGEKCVQKYQNHGFNCIILVREALNWSWFRFYAIFDLKKTPTPQFLFMIKNINL